MDINITELVSENFGGITKTASKNNISNAKALIAKLSKGGNVKSSEVTGILQGLLNDVYNSSKKEKIASLVEDMVTYSQIDESDVGGVIEKFASLDIDLIDLEKKALNLSIDNYSNKSNLFTKISRSKRSYGKKDLDSFLS